MIKKAVNESGFAVVEVVLAVLLVIAIVAVGYFANKAHQSQTKKLSSANTSQSAAKPAPKSQSATSVASSPAPRYLDVTELGFKLTLNSQISSISYSIDSVPDGTDNNGNPLPVTFAAFTVDGCSDAGAIAKYDRNPDGLIGNGSNAKQVGGFYTVFNSPNGTSASAACTAATQAISSAYQTIAPD